MATVAHWCKPDLRIDARWHCQACGEEAPAGRKEVDAELVVSCLRNSPSPDTRQTALKILASTALAKPDFILHNRFNFFILNILKNISLSLTIFTFMGSHLLQVDSKRSFQVYECKAEFDFFSSIFSGCL